MWSFQHSNFGLNDPLQQVFQGRSEPVSRKLFDETFCCISVFFLQNWLDMIGFTSTKGAKR